MARPLQDLLRFGEDSHPFPAWVEAHPQHEARVLAAFEQDTAAAGRSGSSTTPAARADQPVPPLGRVSAIGATVESFSHE